MAINGTVFETTAAFQWKVGASTLSSTQPVFAVFGLDANVQKECETLNIPHALGLRLSPGRRQSCDDDVAGGRSNCAKNESLQDEKRSLKPKKWLFSHGKIYPIIESN